MILVTGGTGLVGAHLLYNLCKTNDKIIAIYRDKKKQDTTKEIFKLYGDSSNYASILWRKADITDVIELQEAFKGVTHVYHAAAFVSFNSKDAHQLRKVNIEGTANIVNFCVENKIKKLCYVSSIATLAKKPEIDIIDESCDWNPEGDHSDYSITKFGAEMEVWRGSQEGLSVVIVNPGVIFGFGAWNTNSSKIFKQIKKGFPFYTKGSVGVVGVQDVVNAMILLMESAIKNERFILVEKNISYQDIFTLIANKLNKTPPKLYINKIFTEIIWRCNWLLSCITFGKIHINITKYSASAAHKKRNYNGSKITKSIAFNYTPFNDVIYKIVTKLS